MIYTQEVEVLGESQVSSARNKATSIAKKIGFSEEEIGRVALVTVELAKNIVKHAGKGGSLLFRPLSIHGLNGIEILALDKGPGMENVAKCLQDQFSTAGSMGIGLGSVVRLSDYYNIYSQEGKGTVFLSQIWGKSLSLKKFLPSTIGAVCLPKPGEESCGDAWDVSVVGDSFSIMVSDGIGHGPEACRASLEAVRTFRKALKQDPVPCLEAIHSDLRGTRGAAVAIANIMPKAGKVNFSGVGNIFGVIVLQEGRYHMVSNNGTLGHTASKIHDFSYPWSEGGALIMHSDGLLTRWNLEDYRRIMAKHPSVIAGLLYRDYFRGQDDVTVVAFKP